MVPSLKTERAPRTQAEGWAQNSERATAAVRRSRRASSSASSIKELHGGGTVVTDTRVVDGGTALGGADQQRSV